MPSLAKSDHVMPVGPIAKKILAALATEIDADALKSLMQAPLDKGPEAKHRPRRSRAEADKVFALYTRALQAIAVLCGTLSHLEEFQVFVDLESEAEQVFCPEGSPAVPITGSYFSSWSWFDAWWGSRRETVGTVILNVIRQMQMDPAIVHLVEFLVGSRMGIYKVVGVDGRLTNLRELVSDQRHTCFVTAGFPGKPGELWFVRVVPPPSPEFTYGITLTTPYVLRLAGSEDWEEFLCRTSKKVKAPKGMDRLTALMKYGLDRSYWFNFISDAYITHRKEAVFLGGTPEAPDGGPYMAAANSDVMALQDRRREVAREMARDRGKGEKSSPSRKT